MSNINNSVRAKKKISRTFVYILLSILSFIWVFPIAWVVLTSFRAQRGSYISTFIPKSFTFYNYTKLFKERAVLDFPRMFCNTLIISIFTCILSSFFILSVAYCMSRLRFKMRRPFIRGAMILTLFPGFMSMIAIYFILKAMGLTEGHMIMVSLILVYSGGSGLSFYIAKGFFDTISTSLDEAAILDGCTKWQVFTKITVPLSKPIIVYTVINSFLIPWLDFIFAKVLCRSNKDSYTVSIGLWKMLEKEYIDSWYTSFAAAAVCISIPIAILFFKMQKCYSEGITGGSIKG